MSSPYQVLDNRPIDQWRVTELKEELKRRRLTIRGLKEDLVKRLDEAVRIERESAQQESNNGLQSDSPPLSEQQIIQPETGNLENVPVQGDTPSGVETVNRGGIEDGYVLVEETVVVPETNVDDDTSVAVAAESVISKVVVSEKDFPSTEILEDNGNSQPELVNEDLKPSNDSKTQLESDNSKTRLEEVILGDYATENQVYEVSPNLGSPVKCDSISTDCVSINEKIEIKDNIIADNVKLELDNSTFVPIGGESHPRPMDVEEPLESNTPIEEKDDINNTNADLSKKFDSMDDVGYSEKLSLDRSSGDDSMEEDVLESSKQVDSKYRPDDSADGSEKIEVSDVKEGSHVDVLGNDIPTEKKGVDDENKDRLFAQAEKRKLNDQAMVGNSETVKRQRRWNTESLKVPEPQSSNLTPTTPKETFQSPAAKGLTKVDPVDDEAPKERVVPPSPKSPTNSLRIDRFVRPFTLKAVQELLGKTGNVTSFWMDHIKTHCYVSYSSVEEAIETRNAVFNLQWPINGGRLLLAEFVDPQEVQTRVDAPPAPAVVPPVPPSGGSQPSPRQPRQIPGPQSLPPPAPLLLSNPPTQARERLPLPPPPPAAPASASASLPEKLLDPPIVTLDDLFRKTKATPRIYYLPLSEEQVAAAKLAAQGKTAK